MIDIVFNILEACKTSKIESYDDLDLIPTDAMATEAEYGLELRRKFKRGGTPVGISSKNRKISSSCGL